MNAPVIKAHIASFAAACCQTHRQYIITITSLIILFLNYIIICNDASMARAIKVSGYKLA